MRAEVQRSSPHKSPRLQDAPLPWSRLVADLLTLSRLVGGVGVAVMPWERSVASLGRLVKYSILLWSTDAVDGKIARFRFGGNGCRGRRSECVHGGGDGHERADVRYGKSCGRTGSHAERRGGSLPLVTTCTSVQIRQRSWVVTRIHSIIGTTTGELWSIPAGVDVIRGASPGG